MTAPDTLHFEMTLGAPILDQIDDPLLDMTEDVIRDLGWIDLLEDVVTQSPIAIFQGQRNGDPLDRVADSGTLKFTLNNSNTNSAGAVGYYSPDHANRRDAFATGRLVRVGLTKDAVTEWLSQGRIISIQPAPGLLNVKVVDVVCGDWIELASRTPMPRVPVQESMADDQVIQLIVDSLSAEDAPADINLAPGAYVYDYVLTDVEDGETPVLTVLQRLAQSGLARIFITGGTTGGEILTYVDLFSLLSTGAPVATFYDDMLDMDALRKANRRVKRVVATGYPMSKDASPVVLYTLTRELQIAAGATVEFIGFYRDPSANSTRSIAAINVVTPVVSTDYKFSSTSGSGTDLNSSLEILDFQDGAQSFYIKARNNAGVLGYLWFFKVRGEGLYPYDSITYTAVDDTIKESESVTLKYDLPYQADYYTIKDIGDALLGWYKNEATEVPGLEFSPTLSDDDYSKMLACKPGELIALSEAVTGVSYTMVVMGREINIYNGGKHITERLFISPAQQVESGLFFTLDTLGQDDLDGDNTILAFG